MASWYMPLLVAPSTALWASPFHPVLEVVTSAPKARLSASMVCGRRGGRLDRPGEALSADADVSECRAVVS